MATNVGLLCCESESDLSSCNWGPVVNASVVSLRRLADRSLEAIAVWLRRKRENKWSRGSRRKGFGQKAGLK